MVDLCKHVDLWRSDRRGCDGGRCDVAGEPKAAITPHYHMDTKERLARDLAETLVETQNTQVTKDVVANWKSWDVYEWLAAWDYYWWENEWMNFPSRY